MLEADQIYEEMGYLKNVRVVRIKTPLLNSTIYAIVIRRQGRFHEDPPILFTCPTDALAIRAAQRTFDDLPQDS